MLSFLNPFNNLLLHRLLVLVIQLNKFIQHHSHLILRMGGNRRLLQPQLDNHLQFQRHNKAVLNTISFPTTRSLLYQCLMLKIINNEFHNNLDICNLTNACFSNFCFSTLSSFYFKDFEKKTKNLTIYNGSNLDCFRMIRFDKERF